MARTTRHAGWLIAALATLPGFPAARALAAEPRPTRPVSVVAQSTKATAATGRRPIAERIAASNLPHRTPVGQPAEPHDAAVAVEPPLPDDAVVTPEHVLPDSGDEHSVADSVSEATPEVAEQASQTDAAVVAVPAVVAEDQESPAVTTETEPVVDTAPLAEATPAPAAPVPAPTSTQPKPSDVVRTRLLARIKGAFAARPRASAGPAAEIAAASPAPAAHAAPQPLAADATAATPVSESAAPARLEFDVRESRSLVGEGEQIVMRIAVRNVGGATAERVTTTLFFADGIEPVQAIGHAAEVFPGEVRFATVPELSPGSSVDLLVTAIGTRPGSVAYRGELACGQLAGPIAREGAVTVQPRRPPDP
ncbi:MAG: hypothetical protein ACKOBP_05035 [Planctomycetia bacterium]